MIAIDLTAVTASHATSAAESDTRFRVTGRDVHNRTQNHQVVKFSGERACCSFQGGHHLHLSARASVISTAPGVPFQVEDVRVGDCIAVDGVVYTIRARKFADPVLVPAI